MPRILRTRRVLSLQRVTRYRRLDFSDYQSEWLRVGTSARVGPLASLLPPQYS